MNWIVIGIAAIAFHFYAEDWTKFERGITIFCVTIAYGLHFLSKELDKAKQLVFSLREELHRLKNPSYYQDED